MLKFKAIHYHEIYIQKIHDLYALTVYSFVKSDIVHYSTHKSYNDAKIRFNELCTKYAK